MSSLEEELVMKAEKTLIGYFTSSPEYERILNFIEEDFTIRPTFSIDCDKLIQKTISDVIDSNVSRLLARGYTADNIERIRKYVYNTLSNSTCVKLKNKLRIISILASKVIEMEKEIQKLKELQRSMFDEIKTEIEELSQ